MAQLFRLLKLLSERLLITIQSLHRLGCCGNDKFVGYFIQSREPRLDIVQLLAEIFLNITNNSYNLVAAVTFVPDKQLSTA